MIDYSVYLWNNPLNQDEPAKAYGRNQVREVWTLEQFAKHIADHNGVYSRGTVKGVISDMCECLVEQLLNGNKIKLGELGDFFISLKTEGAATIKDFSVGNIKEVNIVFTPGEDFENIVDQAEFNLVTSRKVQAAAIKAVKEGADTLDLAALKSASASGSSDDDTDPATPSGGGSTSDDATSDTTPSGSDSGSGSSDDDLGGGMV